MANSAGVSDQERPRGRRDLRALPKTHLHLHFSGSMRLSTLHELADNYRLRLPAALLDGQALRVPANERGWFRFQRLMTQLDHAFVHHRIWRGSSTKPRPTTRPKVQSAWKFRLT